MGKFYAMLHAWTLTKRDEKGATAVEYGLMVALIAIVIITAVTAVGTNLDTIFDAIAAALTTATP